MPTEKVGERRRLFKMECTAKMMILFESANFSRVFFAVGSQGTVVLVLEVIHLLVQSFQVLRYIDPCGFWCDERTGCLIFHIIVLFRVKAEKRLPFPVSRNTHSGSLHRAEIKMWERQPYAFVNKQTSTYLQYGHKKSPSNNEHLTAART